MDRAGKEGSERAWVPAFAIAGVWVCLHLACLGQYGYFRDELYYLACAKRMDWGYVDHPPLSVALLRLWTGLFGDSLVVIRVLPVASGAAVIALVVRTAYEMGVRGWALWFAGLLPATAGMFLVVFHMYSMNAFDILLWLLVARRTMAAVESQSSGQWAVAGFLAGLAVMNKLSALWLVASLVIGFVWQGKVRQVCTRHGFVALIAFATVTAPFVVWQFQSGWPLIEFMRVSEQQKLMKVSPGEFFGQQAVVMNIASVPWLLLGLWAAVREPAWRPLAAAFLLTLAILLMSGKGRVNYLAPAYPLLMAPAAVAAQSACGKRKGARALAVGTVMATGLATVPLGLPLLPPSTLLRVIESQPLRPPQEEVGAKTPLQGYSDMFGWPELACAVESALDGLGPEERSRAVVVTWNYGEAAAIEHFLGPKVRVACGHNSYWGWWPRDWDGSVAIVVNRNNAKLRPMFAEWRTEGTVDAQFAVPEQDSSPVSVARGLRLTPDEFRKAVRRIW